MFRDTWKGKWDMGEIIIHYKIYDGSWLKKKSTWKSNGQQTSKQHSFKVSTSILSSMILCWDRPVIALDDKLKPVNQNQPFLLPFWFGSVFCQNREMLEHWFSHERNQVMISGVTLLAFVLHCLYEGNGTYSYTIMMIDLPLVTPSRTVLFVCL